MPLLARTVFAPLTVQIRRGAVDRLGEILADRRICPGDDVAIVVGSGIGEEVGERVRREHPHVDVLTIDPGTFDAAVLLSDKLRSRGYDAAIGIGGGRVIDTVKYAASHGGLPMVAVATSLAHDGIASPVSVLDRAGSTVSYGVHIPLAAIVDLEYVQRSPIRQTRSGLGDALSNLCAVADWELVSQVHGEPIDGLAVALARTGADALLSHPGSLTDDDFLLLLANALVLGGIAMTVAGSSRPCSGGCHEIAHAITQLYPGVGTHGEQVGLGALFCTFLRTTFLRTDVTLFDQLKAAFERHRLVARPAELGLSNEQFAAAVAVAPRTRPDRYTILEHLALSADGIAAKVAEFVDAVGR